MGRGYDNGKRRKRRKRGRRKRRCIIPVERYVTKKVRVAVRKRDKNKCVYCSRKDRSLCFDGLKPYRTKLEYGHVIPHSMGGDKCVDNIQMECKKCNRTKGATIKNRSLFIKLLGRGADGCKKHKK